MIQINKDYCPANHPCPVLRVCPVNAISQANYNTHPIIDEELCVDCGRCTEACPVFQSNDNL